MNRANQWLVVGGVLSVGAGVGDTGEMCSTEDKPISEHSATERKRGVDHGNHRSS